MEKQAVEQIEIKKILVRVLLVTATIVLPGVDWTVFSWLHPILPLLVFFVLSEQGMYSGNRVILIGTGLGLLGSLLLGSMSLFLFAASLLPVGYVLADSANRKKTPVQAGGRGVLALALCWVILLSGIISPGSISPYAQLLASVTTGIDEAIQFYRASSDISVDVNIMLESTLLQMKAIIPIITPAILACFALFIVWFSAIAGNWLIAKKCGRIIWPHFKYWQLPEKLIWLAIATAVVTFIPLNLVRYIGINILIVMAIIYCFQGFGITVFLMDKWKMPIIFRAFVYVMIVFQSFGAIILLLLGIADTWLNIRKSSDDVGIQE